MEWITVTDESEIPETGTIIVEDKNGWIGHVYKSEEKWILETFGQSDFDIEFSKIVRYMIIDPR